MSRKREPGGKSGHAAEQRTGTGEEAHAADASEATEDVASDDTTNASADADAAAAKDASDTEVDQLRERIVELEEENLKLKDQLLRRQADYDNFRKRMTREKEETVRYGNSMILLDLIEVIDDFDRAIKSSEDSRDFEAFHSGIVLIEKQLTSLLEKKWGLSRFDCEGEPFDPQKHQAIAIEDGGEGEHSLVVEEYQKGYMLFDRVLRPAKVRVSQPKAKVETTEKHTDSESSEGEQDGSNNRN